MKLTTTPSVYFLLFSLFFTITTSYSQIDSVNIPKIDVKYTNKGFQFKTSDDQFLLHIESRLQFRFATPGDQNPISYDEVYNDSQPVFKINRARLKVGGHAFEPWLKYYWEYELSQGNLLDFRIMVEKWEFLKLKIGQWKTYYNRERVISSGKQQLVDRSIITRPFTLDRQQGMELFGRVFPGTSTDFNYNFSILTGAGRSISENDDGNLMYVGRLQYNLFGRELGFIGSDLSFHEKFTGLIAVAGVTNTSKYTRFSQSGGGQLDGFEDGISGQYRVKQAMLETAFMYRGFSWQNEFHIKEIYDHVNAETTNLKGAYFQAGYFLSNWSSFFPKPLEVAGRYTYYVPNTNFSNNLEEEYGLAFNWFFKGGHRNKLTTEFTYFNFEDQTGVLDNGLRFRVQWDISL
ncbi:porin [uncultured Formosa sp.]|uniref:porin n=1 Tax=uncultured Formosa sp. TaxID=255435 RepID=UPI002606489F|nr:porin [uncultured Formosa sp.]